MTRFASKFLPAAVLILATAAVAHGQEATAAALPSNPYAPPACVPGVPFTDVTCTTGFDPWIEQFGADGITAGCGGGLYCPNATVTREQMAVFIEKAMRGTATWSPGDLGSGNTGLGANALLNNIYGEENTAIGSGALYTQSYSAGNSSYQSSNTAVGFNALHFNQPDVAYPDGTRNTAIGANSLFSNTDGYANTALGNQSLISLTFGYDITALGYGAGSQRQYGYFNTFVGASADAAAEYLFDATAIGYNAVVDDSYHVRIGDGSVTQIGGQVAWSNLSDARAKTDIRDLDLGLDFVMALRPVSFTLRQGNGRTDMGFVAQDVEALLGDGFNVLGIGGDKDRTLSLRYADLMAPMVKAIQDQQAQLAAKDARIADLEKNQSTQQAQIDELRAQVRLLVASERAGGGGARP